MVDEEENIRVAVRIRPLQQGEASRGETSCVTAGADGREVQVRMGPLDAHIYRCNRCFPPETTQQIFFDDCGLKDLLDSAIGGYRACAFAFGQTGSGKTWTMSGPPEDRGVNTRALDELFIKTAQRAAEFVDTITLSILEVYNEDIHDLLVDSKHAEKLEIRQAENGIHVPGLTLVAVQNLGNVFEYLQIGNYTYQPEPIHTYVYTIVFFKSFTVLTVGL